MSNYHTMSTPWGIPQSVKEIAGGEIIHIITAGHGGFKVSVKFNRVIKRNFPTLKPWAGEGWYEEDCDWAFVVASFPALFTTSEVDIAFATIPSLYKGQHAAELEAHCSKMTPNRAAIAKAEGRAE